METSEYSSIILDEVIPLGRNGKDYLHMFNLFGLDDKVSYIDCASGPSSFNAYMSSKDIQVVSIDPIYEKQREEIQRNIKISFDSLIDQIKQKQHLFKWDIYRSVEHLSEIRRKAMDDFLSDYENGKDEGRYVAGSLPHLNFANHSFDIALCSHFLFLYSDYYSLDFHIKSIMEMMRVAKECRIFPLYGLSGKESPYLRDVVKILRKEKYQTHICNVPYEFQKGANQCLIIRKKVKSI
ncbi:MAG: hypothetical protein JW717_09100 [Marinilabiliaceae bacterium]|nr:hypothetical protein [Marinilabiliaceae bacterium]